MESKNPRSIRGQFNKQTILVYWYYFIIVRVNSKTVYWVTEPEIAGSINPGFSPDPGFLQNRDLFKKVYVVFILIINKNF